MKYMKIIFDETRISLRKIFDIPTEFAGVYNTSHTLLEKNKKK